MIDKELKIMLGELQEEILKASLPVTAELSNDFKSIILETEQRKISPFMRFFREEQPKYLQFSQNNATYHPMNPDTDVIYQTVNLFSSDKCFIYFISDVPHYIWWNHHNTVCTILVKVDVLDTCGAMICLYFGIAFLLLLKKLPNVFVKSFQDWLNSVQ